VTAVAEHDAGPGRTLLRADLPADGIDAIRTSVGHLVEVSEVEVVDDGFDAWRAHATAVVVGTNLVVRPPWVALDLASLPALPRQPVVVSIDPGRAWGHGAHPTTVLCLREVERACTARIGPSVLDVGCGSGVLGIAAAMLGAAAVWACDLDPVAVETTHANAARNGVGDRVTAVLADADAPLQEAPAAPHDLVVANIGAATLRTLAADLLSVTAPDGSLVLSGLLDTDAAEVADAFAPWRPVRVEVLDGWAAVVLRSPEVATQPAVSLS
jgi:ribosomal protein L11 methyltransferase